MESIDLDEKYLTMTYSKNESNTIHLKIRNEDHTLGNILSERLYNDPRCTFSAYKVPHPLENILEIKISANKDTPVLVLLKETIKKLESDINDVIKDVKRERNEVQ